MKIFRVEGTLVATARIGNLDTHRLLVVKGVSGGKQVAVDPVGCKPGDWVIAVGSSAARDAAGSSDYPSDLTIVGIIDFWDEENPLEEEERSEEPELYVVESAAASGDGEGRR